MGDGHFADDTFFILFLYVFATEEKQGFCEKGDF
jgi:hypothetical protein